MTDTPYTVVRSKRKTVALTIDSSARLIVRSPMRLSDRAIREIVRKNAQWIGKKQKQISDYYAKQSAFVLEEGASVQYVGNSYTVRRREIPNIAIDGSFIDVPIGLSIDGFADWLKGQGEGIIRERVEHYATLMGVKYASVRMSGAKRRWGSCGAGNTLNFAWRLAMCPQSVIDYVVIHELAHVAYKNHGARFWARVSTVMPCYKEAERWLRQNRRLMEVI